VLSVEILHPPVVVPALPPNAPFSPAQRAWLNGFLAGVFYDRLSTNPASGVAAAPVADRRRLLIGFGSQTGGAQRLAKRIAREAGQKNFQATVQELNQITPEALRQESLFLVVTSTWGDGDPPDNATQFWSALNQPGLPPLENLRFGVLGLGDRNYSDFCGAGKKFDERLVALGAQRLVARAECDVDFEAESQRWLQQLWQVLESSPETVSKAAAAPETLPPAPAPVEAEGWNRQRPFPARLKTNRRLNGAGSSKDTRHLEILLEGSGLEYQVGDALGVRPRNCPALVEEILALLEFHGDETVADGDGERLSLHEALSARYVITQPPEAFLRESAIRAGNAELTGKVTGENRAELAAWLAGRDVVDVLRSCPKARFGPQELVDLLRKLQPRLYSISSSIKAHPGEVHLTVAAVRYETHGRTRKGVASTWLADRVVLQQTPVPVFVQTSHGFRLPGDTSAPIVMIGPGTGIAPFRAFLEERRAVGAVGKNWLFFGDQTRAHDFLYEEELIPMQADGFLTRLDLAFSRDQAAKIYVQDRMREQGAELWRWLEAGGFVYVCGDAKRMARDVDAALHQVIEMHGGKTAASAAEYVAALKSAKRYQRDVY
jgi:sulfite reductase (NADPH) flavoprotein alpha-component